VVYYLMQWFPPDMRARTITRFYISLPISSAVMGSLAGAILNLQGHFGLAGWQWLFLLESIPAIILSFVFFLALPDGPTQAQWLSPEEREWMTQASQRHFASRVYHGQSIAPALYDPRTWLLGLFMLCFTATGYAYMLHGPTILQESTHLDATRVGYLIAIFNLFGALVMLLNAIHSDRTQERYWHILPVCLVMAFGFAVCGYSSAPRLVVPGFALLILANSAMQGPLWSLPSTFLGGRSAAAGIAAINTISILGGFVGPYIMGMARDLTGQYQRGLTLMAIPMLVATSIMLCLRYWDHSARTLEENSVV
jgi:ACS family tartrate transporter-like MFS transporter